MSTVGEFVSRARQLAAVGNIAEAESLLRQSLQMAPNDPQANQALGILLLEHGVLAEGSDRLRIAAQAAPDRPDLWYELGMGLAMGERFEEAAEALERSLLLAPQKVQIYELLSQVLSKAQQPAKARDVLVRGLRVDPYNTFLGQGYVLTLKASGQVGEAARAAEQLADAHPDDVDLLMLAAWQSTYWERGDPLRARAWLERRGRHLAPGIPHPRFANPPDPNRRLRVAYLCQDIQRDSPIARFVAPALLNLDRASFELLGYCTQPTLKAMTPRLLGAVGGSAGGWIDVSNLDDATLISRLRADRIDILVETAGNTSGQRQAALARRAAPVQVTCIGDPRTTGNPAIDYRIVDEITDPSPPPGGERFCTERLTRLPGCFLCYEPHEDAPPPRRPLDPAGGAITFGSFNIHDKTGPGVIELWCRILRQVPGSRIVLKSLGMGVADLRKHFLALFSAGGIDSSRVELMPEIPAMRAHLQLYHTIDIALDTFPYNGTTTTCDAMWSGVPVVTLLGGWHAARVGASLLTSVGLTELIARDGDDYVRMATGLAMDRARLAGLHRTLRDQMASSPLLNASAYARDLGDAYRSMWRSWCADSGKH